MDRSLSLAPRAPWWLASFLFALGLALGLTAEPAHGQDCKAAPAWFKTGAPEPDPEKVRDKNCEFHQWAVQELLYQVQIEPNGRARFLNLASPHALFLYTGDRPAPYPGANSTLFKLGAGMAQLRRANDASPLVFLPRIVKTDDSTFDEVTQAGSNAVLIDQKGQWVYYTSSINKIFYDFVVKGGYYTQKGIQDAPAAITYPNGALETKSSWRIASIKGGPTYIPDAERSYFTVDGAQICQAFDAKGCTSFVTAKMALVGLHLAGVVKGHPEMIWATFEHNLNAPDCKDTRSTGSDFSFYRAGQSCGTAPYWEDCNNASTDRKTPSEICRLHPQGEPGASAENTPNIQVLNQSFHQLLPADKAIWANYDYAGAIWTEGEPSDALLVLSNIRGSTKLANTSLESFTQKQHCFDCHRTAPAQMSCFDRYARKNLFLSHLVGLVCKRPKLLASH